MHGFEMCRALNVERLLQIERS